MQNYGTGTRTVYANFASLVTLYASSPPHNIVTLILLPLNHYVHVYLHPPCIYVIPPSHSTSDLVVHQVELCQGGEAVQTLETGDTVAREIQHLET